MKQARPSPLLLWTISITCLLQLSTAGVTQSRTTSTQPATTQVRVVDQIVATYPSRWVHSEVTFTNARELLVPALKPGTQPQARTLITHEIRRSHEEALQRLAEIAANVKSATVTYLQIGGWPAMQRRYSAPLRRRVENEAPQSEPDKLALWTTTVIASGNTLVRMETTVYPNADPKLADEAEAAARQTVAPAPSNPANSEQEVLRLKRGEMKVRRPASTKPASPATAPPNNLPEATLRREERGASQRAAAFVSSGVGELEVAVSNNGQNVVIASNSGVAASADSGATFPTFISRGRFFPFGNQGDPSTTVGASGNFYMAYLGLPNGTPAASGQTGCAITVGVSANNGVGWGVAGNAGFCALTSNSLCSPDQEHISADRINKASGKDQVYVVWRFFTGGAPTCSQLTSGSTTSTIACSTNGGAAWTAPAAAGSGDHPRVTVGGDGSVYVIQIDGDDVVVNKFTSCASGLSQVNGFPVTVLSTDQPSCPVPGLDRCDPQQTASPMLAVDDTNPNHLYVAFVQNTSGSNDNIMVMDSSDGGLTWSDGVNVNSNANGHRFMPWVCSMGGTAFVSWYDRAAANASNNDLTNYFQGSAFLQNGTLVAGSPRNLSTTADPQCASGWPAGADNTNDSTSCSKPQLGGRCQSGAGTGSLTPCNFNSSSCPSGESCQLRGNGAPKYGDYNGIGCGGSRVVSAWTSATAPPGVPSTGGSLQVFDDVLFLPTKLGVNLQVIPFGDKGRFDVLVSGNANPVIQNSGNGGNWSSTVSPGTFTFSVKADPGTTLGAYSIEFGGDCSLNGSVQVFSATSKSCTAFVENKAFANCTKGCEKERDTCMAAAHSGPERGACVQALNACKATCNKATLTVTKILSPSGDPGKFNIDVDGVVRANAVGNGGHTAALKLDFGTHTVSETAATGTNMSNYTSVFGGDCAPDGKVTLTYGDEKECTITNKAAPRLTVVKQLVPANDPGKFNLRIDGVTKAANVGDGGSTQAQVISPGTHTVSETAAAGTNLSDYNRTFAGDCSANGTVTLAQGDHKTCTIINQRKGPACFSACTANKQSCLADCKSTRDQCMAGAGRNGAPLPRECAQEFLGCNNSCNTQANSCNTKCN